jgi:hypothetical protein
MRRSLVPAALASTTFAALGLICALWSGCVALQATALVGRDRIEGILGAGLLVVWGTGLPVLLAVAIAFFAPPAYRRRLYAIAAAVASLGALVFFSLSWA